MTHTKAWAYIRAIRNPHKRAYAERYLRYLEVLEMGEECDEPQRLSKLGAMAAQAVRMNLNAIVSTGE